MWDSPLRFLWSTPSVEAGVENTKQASKIVWLLPADKLRIPNVDSRDRSFIELGEGDLLRRCLPH